MSGSCMCEVHGKRYQIELAVYHDNITALHSTKFSPQGMQGGRKGGREWSCSTLVALLRAAHSG